MVDQLRTVPGLVADLAVVRTGQSRTTAATPRVRGGGEADLSGLHVNTTAAVMRGHHALWRLDSALTAAAAAVSETEGVHPPEHSRGLRQLVLNNRDHHTDPAALDETPIQRAEELAVWLACHPAALRAHPNAEAFARRIGKAVERLQDAIDPEPRRYVGPCPTVVDTIEGETVTCGRRLLARPEQRKVWCPACHRHHLTADIETAAIRHAEAGVWTLGELLGHVLPSIGRTDIARSTLYRWARRRTILPRGYQHSDGRISGRRERATDPEVYRLGDVLAAAAKSPSSRPKQRKGK
ncbi:hypothetical protein ACTD5D_32140 [Nocardia takedensis]|uniref:hypothetical protein n=1 Tax=Nocardia takedensis TaxID=259390 RepID=UPI003F759698